MTDDDYIKAKLEFKILAETWTKQSNEYREKMANSLNDMPEYARLAHEKDIVINSLNEKMLALQDKIQTLKPVRVSAPEIKATKGKKGKKKNEDEEEQDDVIEGEGY